jgi:hypothetical protein
MDTVKPQPATITPLSPYTDAILGRHGTILLQGHDRVTRLNPRELDKLTAAWKHYRDNPTPPPEENP